MNHNETTRPRLRRHRPTNAIWRALRGDRGSASAELVILMPLLLMMLMTIVQFALWSHATHIAQAAAAHGLAVARAHNGTAAAGTASAYHLLDQLAAGPLTGAAVTTDRGEGSAWVRISGTAASVVPFLDLPVHAEAVGPVELFVPIAYELTNSEAPSDTTSSDGGGMMKASECFGSRIVVVSVQKTGRTVLRKQASALIAATTTIGRRRVPIRPAHGADKVRQGTDDRWAFGGLSTSQGYRENHNSSHDHDHRRERTYETNALDHDRLPAWRNWSGTSSTQFNNNSNANGSRGERKVNSNCGGTRGAIVDLFETSPTPKVSRFAARWGRSVLGVALSDELACGTFDGHTEQRTDAPHAAGSADFVEDAISADVARQDAQDGRHRRGWRVAWWYADRGSAASDMTIVAPLMVMLLVFVAVVIHRGVDARLLLEDAAHQSARAASIERSPATALAAAESTAASALSSAGRTCASLTVDTVIGGMRPGGTVTVTVSCSVDFGDALILGVPGHKRLSATAVEPIDFWRSTWNTGSQT